MVTGGSGTVGSTAVTSVTVNCATNRFSVGGTISGLAGTVVLQNNGGDNLTLSANASFAFATTIASGGTYAVTVLTQPGTPSQTCLVTSGSGTVGAANVTSVVVTCSTNSFTLGGTLTGLAAGASVVLQYNSGNNLTRSANGGFTFVAPVLSGAVWTVTVLTNPSGPTQVCTVTPPTNTGTMGSANVTTVAVNCVTSTFTVGGTITGIGAAIVLRNNGGNDLRRGADGAFTFTTALASGTAYSVSLVAQPDGSICDITGSSGMVTSANITSVSVFCHPVRGWYAPHAIPGLFGTSVVGPGYGYRLNDFTGSFTQAQCAAMCDSDSRCESALWRAGERCTTFPFACPQWSAYDSGRCANWASFAQAYQSAGTCDQYKIAYPTATDGTYTLDPGGAGTAAFPLYCDMTTAGGGWTLGFVKNSAHSGTYALFGGANTNVAALAGSANAASASATATAGWLDMNNLPYRSLRVTAHQTGGRTFLSANIARGDMVNRFGTGGAYILNNDANGYYWCGGTRAWNDAGNCKGHSGLGSGWDFGPATFNRGLTMVGNDVATFWMYAQYGAAQYFYPNPGAAQAVWVR